MGTQEVYQRMREHFAQPGAVFGMDLDGMCVYRRDRDASSPVRCAAGALIPDELYLPEMEDKVVAAMLGQFRSVANALALTPAALRFLGEAQIAHDDMSHDGSVDDFVHALDDLAARFELAGIR